MRLAREIRAEVEVLAPVKITPSPENVDGLVAIIEELLADREAAYQRGFEAGLNERLEP